MKELRPKNLKVGDKIWIARTDFYDNYRFIVFEAFVYRKIGDEASYKRTKEDRYEVEFYVAFPTKEDAYKSVLQELREYKIYKNKEINRKIEEIKHLTK